MNRPISRNRTMAGYPRPTVQSRPPRPLSEFNQELRQLPLAMAYVPIQPWGETYPPERALARGTLFPALDLPFGEVTAG